MAACTGPNSNPVDPTDTMPTGSPLHKIRITSITPYVTDGDSASETWTIKNYEDTAVAMSGWFVRDPEAVRTTNWDMSALGVLAPKEEKRFTSTLSAQFNNNGDDVQLISPSGDTIQTITFGKLTIGQVIRP